MTKARNIFTIVMLAVGGALLLAGAALFLIGFGLEGWDADALTNVQYEQHSYTAQGEIHSVHIRFGNAQVRVKADEGAERVTLSYPVRVDSEGVNFLTGDVIGSGVGPIDVQNRLLGVEITQDQVINLTIGKRSHRIDSHVSFLLIFCSLAPV